MEYWIWTSGLIGCFPSYYPESFGQVERKCCVILFVDIYFDRTPLFCKIHEGRPVTVSATVAVDEKHLYHIMP